MEKNKAIENEVMADREFQEVLVIFESRAFFGELLQIFFSRRKIFRRVHLAHDLNHPILFELAKEPVVYLISGTSYPQIWNCVRFITQHSSQPTMVILDELFRCGTGHYLKHFQVHGYWTCHDSAEQIVQGLIDAVERQKSLSQHAEMYLTHSQTHGIQMNPALKENPLYKLSQRQKLLFQLIAEGKNIDQCVQEMKITHKAVRNLRKRLLNKLDLSSESDIIWKAIELGFIDHRTKRNMISQEVPFRCNVCKSCKYRDLCESHGWGGPCDWCKECDRDSN